MDENRPVDIFLHTPQRPAFFFVRDVVKNVLPRSLILLVLLSFILTLLFWLTILDCPEREATYIITTGGINDPDKA